MADMEAYLGAPCMARPFGDLGGGGGGFKCIICAGVLLDGAWLMAGLVRPSSSLSLGNHITSASSHASRYKDVSRLILRQHRTRSE